MHCCFGDGLHVRTQTGTKKTSAAYENEEERHETLQFMVKRLSDDLFRELLDGLRIMPWWY